MVALQRPKAGSRPFAGIFTHTISMLTIYTLPMAAAAFLDRQVHKVNKDHRVLPVRALVSR